MCPGRMPGSMNHVDAAAVGQTLAAFDHMFDIIAARFLDRRHIELVGHHFELEGLFEFLESAGVIAVAMGEHAEFQV